MKTTFERRGALGLFELTGTRDRRSLCDFWAGLSHRVSTERLDSVFVHDRSEGNLDATDLVEMERGMRASALSHHLPIAIVNHDRRAAALFELLLLNRFWSLIHVFTTEREAETWLLGLRPAQPEGGGP